MADVGPHLLIAYDGSPNATTAVRAAASLFRSGRASIATVPWQPSVRVGTATAMLPTMSPIAVEQALDGLDTEARREADESMAQAVEQARTLGLEAEAVTISPSAPAWAALLDTAHRLGADVLVSGTRGRGAFARALLGSTSSSLLHHTDLPLVIVPGDGAAPPDGPVVVAYDGSEGSRHAIQAVGRLLGGRSAVVVHAWEPVFHGSIADHALAAASIDDLPQLVMHLHEALAERAATTTEEGVAAARAAGLDAVGDTVEADVGIWRAVVTAARAHAASVIATGTRGLGAARSVLLGSVSSGLVQNAELPVLVVPDEAPATGRDG